MTAVSASPRRVHDLELFLEALVCLEGGKTHEDEIVTRLRRKARELNLRSAGMGIFSVDDEAKSLAIGTVREVMRELRGFGLIAPQAGGHSLTPDGRELARLFAQRRSSRPGLNRLAELHLRRFPNLRRLLDALGAAPSGAFFIPRPSPRDFDLTVGERNLEAYAPYVEASSEYAASELRSWGVRGVRRTSIQAAVGREARDKDALYQRRGTTWTHRIMIDTIRDALTRTALSRLVPGLGVVDFEIFCSRGSSLGLLNYTDHLEGALGRVVYATAWRHNTVPTWIKKGDLELLRSGSSETDGYCVHSPSWKSIRTRLEREVYASYEQLRKHKRSLAPPVADVRDAVCFRLRLSDHDFNRLLARLYHETMQANRGLGISLEADEIRETRGQQTTKRNPLYLSNAAPRTVIRVYRRD